MAFVETTKVSSKAVPEVIYSYRVFAA